jgi:hypothetical protein
MTKRTYASPAGTGVRWAPGQGGRVESASMAEAQPTMGILRLDEAAPAA